MKEIELPIEYDKTTPTKPDLKWGAKMLGILVLFLISGYAIFYGFAHIVIGNISLEEEKEFFGEFFSPEEAEIFDFSKLKNGENIKSKLKNVDVFVIDSPEVNAYAGVGGVIMVTQGLLENIDYEEELIFILGHELEHIKNRDPLNLILTNLPFKLTLIFLGMDIDLEVINISDFTNNVFSRKVELNADSGGIAMIQELGLNLECSANFFEKDDSLFSKYLGVISTHPDNMTRIENIKNKIKKGGEVEECSDLDY